jgi:hypothetical protein
MASGNTIATLTPLNYEPPSSNYGRPDEDAQSRRLIDLAVDEIFIGSGMLPMHYAGGGFTVEVHFAMSSSTGASKFINLNAQIERRNDGADMTADGYAAAQTSANHEVPAAAGELEVATITFTDGAQMDNLAVGEHFGLKLTRIDVTGGVDEAAGDLELRAIHIKET